MPYQPLQRQRIDAGQCKDCGSERGPDGTSIRCRPCADEHNADVIRRKQDLRAEWQTAGSDVCNICGGIVEDLRYLSCEGCRTKRRGEWERRAADRRHQREAGGICVTCMRPALAPSRYCRRHVLDNCLRRYVAAEHYETLWRKLEEQGFRCYYTGLPLTPGVDATIDHRVPISRGGGRDDLSNLVWCERDVNAFKGDLTDVEFIARCKAIADRFAA